MKDEHEDTPRAGAADESRRAFFWKLGAGVSTAVAAAASAAARAEPSDGDSSLRVALLEDEKALRKLHRSFEHAIDGGRYAEAAAMFTDDAQVVFNGGVFDNRTQGVSRLFDKRFRAGKTGKRMEPAPGFELAPAELEDEVDVTPDRSSAKAVFPYSIQVGRPIESDTSLASMARIHGDGVQTWWEGGVYAVTYRRDAADGRWKISRLEYKTLARADYRPGRSHAGPIAVPRMTTRYPEDPHGPDAVV